MEDVVRKRVVGAAVLVLIGVMLPLLLVRCLHQPQLDGQAMRVYEITPSGDVQPVAEAAGGDTAAEQGPAEVAPTQQAGEETVAGGDQPEYVSAPAEGRVAIQTGSSAVESEPANTAVDEPPRPRPASDAGPVSASEPENADETSIKRSVAPGAWVVQVASFRKESNARALARALAGHFTAYYTAAEIDGKTWYRVRVGPLESEAVANNAAGELRALGHNTLVQQVE